ncbi:flippase [Haloferax larsenii]|uniref:Flippase n=1 Tax=Haloferax larsenii TaxID=302484 RepID=A0ABY5RE26_HALLR|nr:flippase [Haloferax larsenii]UVE50434.1 flippase [Haloferax larsenii]
MNISLSTSKLFVAKVANTVLSFAAFAYFARKLGAGVLGTFFLFQALLGVLSIVADAGIGTAVEQRIGRGERVGEVVAAAAAITVAGAGLVGLGLFVFRGDVAAYVGVDAAPFILAALVLSRATTIAESALRGELRVGETAALQLVQQLVFIGLATALVVAGGGALELVGAYLAGLGVRFAWAVWKLRPSIARPSLARIRSLLAFGKYNIIPTIGLQVHSWMDVLIIGFILTQDAVGTYEIAWRVAGVTLLLTHAIGPSILPQTSAWAEANADRIGRLLTRATTPALALIIPAAVGAFLIGSDLLEAVFGPPFAGAWLVLVVLILGKIPEAIQILVGRCLLGLDRPDLVARATVVGISLNLVLNVVLIFQFGLIGAAVATTLAYTAGMVIRVVYLSRLVTYRLPVANLLRLTAAAAVMGVAVAGLLQVAPPSGLVAVLAYVGFGGVVYAVSALCFESIRSLVFDFARAVTSGG